MPFTSFLDYLSLEKNYSKHTLIAYHKDLLGFREFALSEFDFSEVNSVSYAIIRSWIVKLVGDGVSNRTINRKISSLRTYYKFLLKIGDIEVSPLLKHKVLKTAKKLQVPFSEKEIEDVLEILKEEDSFLGLRNKLIVELFYSTGMRRGELVNLKLNDISDSQKTIKVLGKRNKERIIPLLPSALNTIASYIDYRKSLSSIKDVHYLLLTEKGAKVYETLVYRVINNYFSKASEKVKKSPHILRHSFATHLLNEGADIKSVKELLGHSSLASTQIYANNSISKLQQVYKNAHPRNSK
ncbi:MAG: tyrosine-type recombinase/integrase [Flavobacteriaceae bacterium]|jgi:integrase/recombinase XerC|nr:tyrosine-type recombinase/integrase [Flavobacteriaceae bacterium]MBT3920778.1 tyrosine-type recombinase/integrase [Flavobacteriaceae bacterium]MBT6704404.1 tyrosine-type recombinase/integrase [Flavobacteriaceae bacterium]